MIHKHIYFIYLFFPVIFITGPFITDLIIGYINIYFFFNFKKLKNEFSKLYNENKILFNLIFSFFIISLVSSINSSEKFLAFYKSFFHFRFYIFFIFSILFFKHFLNKKKKFFFLKNIYTLIFIILSLSVVIEALVLFLYNKNFIKFHFEVYQYARFSGFFGHELIAGSFLKNAIIYLLLFSFLEQTRKNIIIGSIFIIIIFLTGDRMAFLYSLPVYIVILILNKRVVNLKFLSIFVLVSLCSIVSLMQNSYELKQRYISLYDHVISLTSFDSAKNLDSNYFQLFSSAIRVWEENKLLGVGVRNYRLYCQNLDEVCSTHPHNFYLEILSENGLLGLIIFLGIIAYLILPQHIPKFFMKKNFVTFICFFALLSPFAATGSFYNNHYSANLWIMISYIFFFKKYFNLSKE